MNEDGRRHGNVFIKLRNSPKLVFRTLLSSPSKDMEIETEKLSQKIQSRRQKMFVIPTNTFN